MPLAITNFQISDVVCCGTPFLLKACLKRVTLVPLDDMPYDLS